MTVCLTGFRIQVSGSEPEVESCQSVGEGFAISAIGFLSSHSTNTDPHTQTEREMIGIKHLRDVISKGFVTSNINIIICNLYIKKKVDRLF